MKNTKYFFLLSLLTFGLVSGASSIKEDKAIKNKVLNKISTSDEFHDGRFIYTPYTGYNATLLTNAQAGEESLPIGYTNEVLKLGPNSSPIIDFDFTSGNYKLDDIGCIVFRVCATGTVSGTYPAFRLRANASGGYLLALASTDPMYDAGGMSLSSKVNTWYDVVVSTANLKNNTFSSFASASDASLLGNMQIVYRTSGNASLYFDSVTVYTKEDFTNGNFTYTTLAGTSTLLFEEQMNELGIAGTTGGTLKLTGSPSAAVQLDFSTSKYKLSKIESITFKVYATGTVSGNKPEVRMQNEGKANPEWGYLPASGSALRGDAGATLKNNMNEWVELSLDTTSINSSNGWSIFADKTDSTILGKISIMNRCPDSNGVLYINDIQVNLDTAYDDFTNNGQFTFANGAGTNTLLKASEMAALGITGSTNSVLRLTGNASAYVMLDFSNSKIKLSEIESITFRVYATGTVSGNKPEFRIKEEAMTNWSYLPSLESGLRGDGGATLKNHLNEWMELTLDESTINHSKKWNLFADSTDPTILGKMAVMDRCAATTDAIYIDSVTVKVDTSVSSFTNNQFTYSALAGSATLLKDSEMAETGITGYTDSVLKITGNVSSCVWLDFTEADIKMALIESITFRVYATGTVSGKKPEFRIQNEDRDTWVFLPPSGHEMRGDGGWSLSSHMNEWLDLTMDASTINSTSKWDILTSKSDSTRLGKFLMMLRCADSADALYVDSVTVNLKENDHVAPVITYTGATTLTVHAEQKVVVNATAYDAQEDRAVEIEYVFDKNAVVHDNRISNQGTFTLTLKATDYYGNYSTIDLTIIVIEQDTTAPVINIPDTLTLKAGMYVGQLNVGAAITDNSGQFEYEVVFSTGAVINNILQAGTHTMTITATDLSENETVKVVTLVVNSTGQTGEFDSEDEDLKAVIEFVETYMHMDDYNDNLGYCSDTEHHYYASAKTAYNALSDISKKMFNEMDEFAAAKERLIAWASFNNDVIIAPSYKIVSVEQNNIVMNIDNTLMIVTISLAGLTALGYFLLKKKKHQ